MGAAPRDLYVGVCPVTGKRQYKNRKNAKAASRTLPGTRAFTCVHCGMFHVGSRGDWPRTDHQAMATQMAANYHLQKTEPYEGERS